MGAVEWFSASDDWLSRWVFERGLALTYVVAFVVVLNQFRPLLGEHGLMPVPRFLAAVPFKRSPSLFHWRYSDRLLGHVGVGRRRGGDRAPGGAPAAGRRSRWPMVCWASLWVLYLSVVNVGQRFYSFGWESLLLEVGLPRVLPRRVVHRATGDRDVPAALAAVPARARRGPHQAARRSVLAGPHLPPVPPRDTADARAAQRLLPPPAEGAAPGGGARQPRRAASRAVVPVRARAAVDDRGRGHRGDAGLPDDQRQLLVAQLPHHRARRSR